MKSLGFGYRVLGALSTHVGRLNARVRALTLGYLIPISGEPADVAEFLGKGIPLDKHLANEVMIQFSNQIVGEIRTTISKRSKIVLGQLIKQAVAEQVSLFWRRFGEAYLMSLLKRELPEAGLLAADSSPMVSIDLIPGRSYLLPPHLFNRVKNDIEELELQLTNIYSMILGESFAENRTKLLKLKTSIDRAGHGTTLVNLYTDAVGLLKEASDVSEVRVDLTRADEVEPRLSFEVVHIKV